jgi:hypothetical protein
MKNVVFWVMGLCRSPFGGTYRLHFQGRKIRGISLQAAARAGASLADFSTVKIEASRSSETSVHVRFTQRHGPEDGILQCHRCESLKS